MTHMMGTDCLNRFTVYHHNMSTTHVCTVHRCGTDLRKTPLLCLRVSRCVAQGCRVIRRGCRPSERNSSPMSDGNMMFTLLWVPTCSLHTHTHTHRKAINSYALLLQKHINKTLMINTYSPSTGINTTLEGVNYSQHAPLLLSNLF